MNQRIKLLFYPAAELLVFLLALHFLKDKPLLSAGLILLAAVALNFSLHISFHYQVHFSSRSGLYNFLIETGCSLLMGMSFQYYRMSHWNHHRYDNRLGDFTCTWKEKNGLPVPRNLLAYALLWPLGALQLKQQTEQALQEGYLTKDRIVRMHLENLFLLVLIGSLFLLNLYIGISYLAMVYLGWVLIAMHNYGQHLPEKYGQNKAYSYYDRVYNLLFLRNGWHLEHHAKPNLRYWDLEPAGSPAEISHPHLLEGFFHRKDEPEKELNKKPTGAA